MEIWLLLLLILCSAQLSVGRLHQHSEETGAFATHNTSKHKDVDVASFAFAKARIPDILAACRPHLPPTLREEASWKEATISKEASWKEATPPQPWPSRPEFSMDFEFSRDSRQPFLRKAYRRLYFKKAESQWEGDGFGDIFAQRMMARNSASRGHARVKLSAEYSVVKGGQITAKEPQPSWSGDVNVLYVESQDGVALVEGYMQDTSPQGKHTRLSLFGVLVKPSRSSYTSFSPSVATGDGGFPPSHLCMTVCPTGSTKSKRRRYGRGNYGTEHAQAAAAEDEGRGERAPCFGVLTANWTRVDTLRSISRSSPFTAQFSPFSYKPTVAEGKENYYAPEDFSGYFSGPLADSGYLISTGTSAFPPLSFPVRSLSLWERLMGAHFPTMPNDLEFQGFWSHSHNGSADDFADLSSSSSATYMRNQLNGNSYEIRTSESVGAQLRLEQGEKRGSAEGEGQGASEGSTFDLLRDGVGGSIILQLYCVNQTYGFNQLNMPQRTCSNFFSRAEDAAASRLPIVPDDLLLPSAASRDSRSYAVVPSVLQPKALSGTLLFAAALKLSSCRALGPTHRKAAGTLWSEFYSFFGFASYPFEGPVSESDSHAYIGMEGSFNSKTGSISATGCRLVSNSSSQPIMDCHISVELQYPPEWPLPFGWGGAPLTGSIRSTRKGNSSSSSSSGRKEEEEEADPIYFPTIYISQPNFISGAKSTRISYGHHVLLLLSLFAWTLTLSCIALQLRFASTNHQVDDKPPSSSAASSSVLSFHPSLASSCSLTMFAVQTLGSLLYLAGNLDSLLSLSFFSRYPSPEFRGPYASQMAPPADSSTLLAVLQAFAALGFACLFYLTRAARIQRADEKAKGELSRSLVSEEAGIEIEMGERVAGGSAEEAVSSALGGKTAGAAARKRQTAGVRPDIEGSSWRGRLPGSHGQDGLEDTDEQEQRPLLFRFLRDRPALVVSVCAYSFVILITQLEIMLGSRDSYPGREYGSKRHLDPYSPGPPGSTSVSVCTLYGERLSMLFLLAQLVHLSVLPRPCTVLESKDPLHTAYPYGLTIAALLHSVKKMRSLQVWLLCALLSLAIIVQYKRRVGARAAMATHMH